MLNLDIDYLAVKLETVLDLINEIKKEADPKSSDFRVQQDIKNQLVGKLVVTRYNNHIYAVKDIDFTKNPTSTFNYNVFDSTLNKKKYGKKSYKDYISEKYYKEI